MFCVVFCHSLNIYGQFLDEFSDTDLNTNPAWEGDLQDFIVNDEQMLQLNAADGGVSQLFTQLNMSDSIQWDFEALMDFSPSSSNRLRVYLALDGTNPEEASGYFFEIGENGSSDALNFYHLSNGDEELLGQGEMSALSNEPAFVKVAVSYFPGGEWLIKTAYTENFPVADEIELIDDRYSFEGNQIFMLECNYTSSRSDKFYFDNVGIKKFEVDRIGPEIVAVSLIDKRRISILANEKLDEASVNNIDNYTISNFQGNITSIQLSESASMIELGLSSELSSGSHSVSISNLRDENGNISEAATFEVFVVDQVEANDLVVNEILFNPETGGSDFVEIYNNSDKFISLGNLSLLNADRDDLKAINADFIIGPGKYICLSEDVDYLRERYQTPDSAQFLQIDIPAFNNESGNVSIFNPADNTLIDSYNYDEEQHFSQLDDLNGVSLERVSPDNDRWFSASASVFFASPGYRNSAFLNPSLGGEETLSFQNKTFSPNQDGEGDQLVIQYKLPDVGYLVDINIFDQYGRKIKTLVNNELFPEEGFVLWDGSGELGEKLSIGIYFVVFEAYNASGNVIKEKKPAILADFLD